MLETIRAGDCGRPRQVLLYIPSFPTPRQAASHCVTLYHVPSLNSAASHCVTLYHVPGTLQPVIALHCITFLPGTLQPVIALHCITFLPGTLQPVIALHVSRSFLELCSQSLRYIVSCYLNSAASHCVTLYHAPSWNSAASLCRNLYWSWKKDADRFIQFEDTSNWACRNTTMTQKY